MEVKCQDCKYLEFEMPYAVCSKAYKGIVNPDDSCGRGVSTKTDREILSELIAQAVKVEGEDWDKVRDKIVDTLLQDGIKVSVLREPVSETGRAWRCHSCDEVLLFPHYEVCCPHCGQPLDWSDVSYNPYNPYKISF